jgi:selenium metabolism protein YedF
MKKIIDAKGLSCPQPVILTKKALEEEDEITVIVDNAAAVENVKRMGTKSGCTVDIEEKTDGTVRLHLTRKGQHVPDKEEIGTSAAERSNPTSAPFVVVISSDRMGRGDDELGYVLIRSFVHTLLSLDPLPDSLIFYNAGVKLTVEGADVLDDLKQLEAAGVSLLVCGTCANYFGMSDTIAAGCISNMYDIVSVMAGAGRLITP